MPTSCVAVVFPGLSDNRPPGPVCPVLHAVGPGFVPFTLKAQHALVKALQEALVPMQGPATLISYRHVAWQRPQRRLMARQCLFVPRYGPSPAYSIATASLFLWAFKWCAILI
jgi:hypothetical protein